MVWLQVKIELYGPLKMPLSSPLLNSNDITGAKKYSHKYFIGERRPGAYYDELGEITDFIYDAARKMTYNRACHRMKSGR